MKETTFLNKEHEKAAFLDKALDDYMAKCAAEEQQRKNNKKISLIESDNRSLGQKIATHERNIFSSFDKLVKRFRK
jgi:hypothetical protein